MVMSRDQNAGRGHKKNTEALVVATREIGLEINAHKTKYMVMSRDQNAGRGHSVKMDNSSFEGGTVQIFGNNPRE